MTVMEAISVVVWGYLAGSLPFAFLLGRRRGVDLRLKGSGNVGATNVLRTSGVTSALLAMIFDGAKGATAVWVALWFTNDVGASVAAGLAAVIGHVYPVWLGFRGGKGVATTAGVFLVFEPVAVAIAGGVFVVGVLSTHYVSVGSLAAAMTLAVVVMALDAPVAVRVGAAAAAVIVVSRHRANVVRLCAGTERRIAERES